MREMLPKAHFASVYAKPAGRPMVDTFVTEVSQDTWIYLPWDMGLAFAPPILDRATSLAGRSMTAKGRAMFAADPTNDILDLAVARAPVEVPAAAAARSRQPRVAVRRLGAAAAALATVYATFTLGVGTATAHGIGVAHPPRKTSAVYLGVRLGPTNIDDPALPAALGKAHATAIIPGRLAARHPDVLRRLQAAGVQMANGGWGHRDRLHWGRARSDLMRSPKAIHAATGLRTRDFVPQRRIDGFDLASARLAHERVIVPTVVLEPGDSLSRIKAGSVVVVDCRDEPAADIVHALDIAQQRVVAAGLSPVSLAQM